MMDAFLGIFLMVLCVVGVVSIIRACALSLAASKHKGNRVYAVLLENSTADIELQMAMYSVEWDGALSGAKALAIDGGLDEETAEYCRRICEGSAFSFVGGEDAVALKKILFE